MAGDHTTRILLSNRTEASAVNQGTDHDKDNAGASTDHLQ